MTIIKAWAVVAACILMPMAASAQMADQVEIKDITDKYDMGVTRQPSFSLIDLSRLHLSHSYSVSFFSGSSASGSQALYNGTVTYQIAQPLTLTLNLGILHDPGAIFGGQSNFGANATFLPSGWLDWRPSENFRMSVGFETIPAYGYNNGMYNMGRYRYWR